MALPPTFSLIFSYAVSLIFATLLPFHAIIIFFRCWYAIADFFAFIISPLIFAAAYFIFFFFFSLMLRLPLSMPLSRLRAMFSPDWWFLLRWFSSPLTPCFIAIFRLFDATPRHWCWFSPLDDYASSSFACLHFPLPWFFADFRCRRFSPTTGRTFDTFSFADIFSLFIIADDAADIILLFATMIRCRWFSTLTTFSSDTCWFSPRFDCFDFRCFSPLLLFRLMIISLAYFHAADDAASLIFAAMPLCRFIFVIIMLEDAWFAACLFAALITPFFAMLFAIIFIDFRYFSWCWYYAILSRHVLRYGAWFRHTFHCRCWCSYIWFFHAISSPFSFLFDFAMPWLFSIFALFLIADFAADMPLFYALLFIAASPFSLFHFFFFAVIFRCRSHADYFMLLTLLFSLFAYYMILPSLLCHFAYAYYFVHFLLIFCHDAVAATLLLILHQAIFAASCAAPRQPFDYLLLPPHATPLLSWYFAMLTRRFSRHYGFSLLFSFDIDITLMLWCQSRLIIAITLFRYADTDAFDWLLRIFTLLLRRCCHFHCHFRHFIVFDCFPRLFSILRPRCLLLSSFHASPLITLPLFSLSFCWLHIFFSLSDSPPPCYLLTATFASSLADISSLFRFRWYFADCCRFRWFRLFSPRYFDYFRHDYFIFWCCRRYAAATLLLRFFAFDDFLISEPLFRCFSCWYAITMMFLMHAPRRFSFIRFFFFMLMLLLRYCLLFDWSSPFRYFFAADDYDFRFRYYAWCLRHACYSHASPSLLFSPLHCFFTISRWCSLFVIFRFAYVVAMLPLFRYFSFLLLICFHCFRRYFMRWCLLSFHWLVSFRRFLRHRRYFRLARLIRYSDAAFSFAAVIATRQLLRWYADVSPRLLIIDYWLLPRRCFSPCPRRYFFADFRHWFHADVCHAPFAHGCRRCYADMLTMPLRCWYFAIIGAPLWWFLRWCCHAGASMPLPPRAVTKSVAAHGHRTNNQTFTTCAIYHTLFFFARRHAAFHISPCAPACFEAVCALCCCRHIINARRAGVHEQRELCDWRARFDADYAITLFDTPLLFIFFFPPILLRWCLLCLICASRCFTAAIMQRRWLFHLSFFFEIPPVYARPPTPRHHHERHRLQAPLF